MDWVDWLIYCDWVSEESGADANVLIGQASDANRSKLNLRLDRHQSYSRTRRHEKLSCSYSKVGDHTEEYQGLNESYSRSAAWWRTQTVSLSRTRNRELIHRSRSRSRNTRGQ